MKENIIVLLVDQWPADCFGHKGAKIKTPNLDKLAKEGLVFENAFTSCPLCSPARGTLFTSKWQNQTGMIDNMGIGYSEQEPLNRSVLTWIDAAIKSGYHTGYYGKWHLGPDGPIERGVHKHPESIEADFKPYVIGESTYSYEKWQEKYEKQSEVLINGLMPYYGTTDKKIEETNPYVVANQAKEFLQDYVSDAPDKPFLLTVSINDPHFPHYLPENYVQERFSEKIDLPKNIEDSFENKPWFQNKSWWPSMEVDGLDKTDWEEIIRYAYTHRMLVDDALGEVLMELETLELAGNTTVIFVSDHGDMCGAHNRFDKGPYFYDEVFRIPLIIRKAEIKPRSEKALVSILDVGATVFDMVGYEGVEELFGNSLVPMIKEEESGCASEVYGMYERYNGMSFRVRAIRNLTYKYVYNPQSIDELYSMEKDPGELENLIDNPNYRAIKDEMRHKLKKWLEDIDDTIMTDEKTMLEAGTIIPLGTPGP